MRQAINQYLKARKGFKLMERDDPMDVDFVHKERKRQGQRKAHRQEERMLGERRWSRETRKLAGDVNWIMMVQDLSVGQSSTSENET